AQVVAYGVQQPDNVGPEVKKHGNERTELNDRRESRAGITPTEQSWDDAQMRGAADRQKLSQPLYQAQHHRMQQRHPASSATPFQRGTIVARLAIQGKFKSVAGENYRE